MANRETLLYRSFRVLRPYLYAGLWVAAAIVLRTAASGTLEGTPYLAFYPACVFAAMLGGFGPGLFAVAASWLWVDLVFDATPGRIDFADAVVHGRFLVFFIGGLGISVVAEWRLRAQRSERKAKEAALHLGSIVASSDDAIIGKTPDGIITSWNRGAEELYGYSAGEAIGQHISLLIPEQSEEITEILRKVTAGQRVEPHETQRRRKDGTLIDVWLKVSPILDASGAIAGISSIAHDITARKEAERKLQASQRSLVEKARLLDLSSDAILVRSLDEKIIYWNEGAVEAYGYGREEALGRSPHELLRTEFPERLRLIREKLLQDGRWSGELIHHRKDGKRMTVSSRWSLDRDELGNPAAILETNTDISPRKHAEEALRESEKRVRAKLESIVSPEGDLGALELADIIDVPSLQPLFDSFYALVRMPLAVVDVHGRVLIAAGWQDICISFHRVNPESRQYCIESDRQLSLNIPAGEYRLYHCKNHMWDAATPIVIAGRHLGNVFSGQFFFTDEAPDTELFREQAELFGFPQAEYLAALERVPRLDRKLVSAAMGFLMKLADVIAKVSYSNLKLARALAEQDRLTKALRESEQRFRAMAENVPQMVWVADAETNFAYLSPRWLEYTGTTVQENAGRGWASLVHPDDRPGAIELWRTATAQGTGYEAEYRLRRHDGQYRWHLTRAMPFFDPNSSANLWFGTTTDIEDQKRTHEALIRSEKLASVGRMAATIAHEINNPLELVTNSVFIASLDKGLERQSREALEAAQLELERIAQLTRQTLGFYRESTAPAAVELGALAKGVIDLYAPKFMDRDINIEHEYEEHLRVHAIAGEIRQVISNMLANAIDACGRGGRVRIRACRVSLNGASSVRLTIADTGEGIAPENLGHIFEPFFTTKATVGTGLGLWVSNEIIRRHRGKIRVRSRLQRGTVFSVFLPEHGKTTTPPSSAARDSAASGNI